MTTAALPPGRSGWACFLVGMLWACTAIASAQIVVRDDAGYEVRLDGPARRIVALAPSQAELIDAAGAGERLTGVSSFTDHPPGAMHLPIVASAGRVDFERVVHLQPDLIVAWHSGNPIRDVDRLRRLGFNVFSTEPRRLDDIPRLIRLLGRLTGTEGVAGQAAHAFEHDLARLTHAPVIPVPAFVAVWHAPLVTVNREHLIDDILRRCGGVNVFAHLSWLAPRVSAEQLLRADPRLIIASAAVEGQAAVRAAFRRFPLLDAVRNNRIAVIDPGLLHRQSPGVLEGVRAVCTAVAAAGPQS